jgi:NDP-sugar pyrophosphorylase family protein
MKAMILAAGLGTRLRPLTESRPKALVEIDGRTMLELTLSRLRDFGIREVIVNVHHFAEMIIEYLKTNGNFGMRIEVSREEVLLDTGGGLKQAARFFLEDSSASEEPFLLHNVDVLSNIDFRRMLEFHSKNQALATLAVQARESSRYLLFDEQLRLCGRRVIHEGKTELLRPASQVEALAFSGIHVISPRLLTMMPGENAFSIIDCYLQVASHEEAIVAFRADEWYWRDLGSPENLMQAAQDLKEGVLR